MKAKTPKVKKPKPFSPYNKPAFYDKEPQEYLSDHTRIEVYEVGNDERLKNIPEGCYVTLRAQISYDCLDYIEVSVCKEGKQINPNYKKELAAYNIRKKAHEVKLKEFNKHLAEYNAEQEKIARESRYKQFLKLQAEFSDKTTNKTTCE